MWLRCWGACDAAVIITAVRNGRSLARGGHIDRWTKRHVNDSHDLCAKKDRSRNRDRSCDHALFCQYELWCLQLG